MITISRRMIAIATVCTAAPVFAQTDTRSTDVQSSERTQNIGMSSSARDPGASQQKQLRSGLEEIIVTAQRRQERLIDVPQAISVTSADDLTKLAAVQFRDFADTVPGLSFQTEGAGLTQISMRGVTVGKDVSATVGVYVDDVPYGSSTATRSSVVTFDAGLFDLDRIEVLRGPQGTLYGVSTMGGVIKYVTKQPDMTKLGVNMQTGVSGTRNGGVSYHGGGTLNVPLVADKAAVRATGYYARDAGYIDNVALAKSDVNQSDVYGGRVDFLMNPAESLSVRITGFLQNISRDGFPLADFRLSGTPIGGSLEQRRLFDEPFDSRFRVVSGTATYRLPSLTLTSISSYQTNETKFITDVSLSFVPILQSIGLPISAASVPDSTTIDRFTQEVRITSEGDGLFNWLVGGFYAHEKSEFAQEILLRDMTGQPVRNNILNTMLTTRDEEYAAFGDVTLNLSESFDVTGGVRYARNNPETVLQDFVTSGPARRSARTSDDVLTYLANARYHFNDHGTAYLRYATGYRPGGANFLVTNPITGLPLAPATYDSDTLESYEAGLKVETADGRFGFDVAGYYIDWSDIQVVVVRGGLGARINAPGGATVRGAEISVAARALRGLTVTGAFSYQDAELAQDEPGLRAAKGERLPTVPRVTGVLNTDYELPFGSLRPTVGATVRYVDDRTAGFGVAYRMPEYTSVDFRVAATVGEVDAQIYIRNAFDERGQLSPRILGAPTASVQPISILQPRTIGLMVSTQF